jgi:hypothetical protein
VNTAAPKRAAGTTTAGEPFDRYGNSFQFSDRERAEVKKAELEEFYKTMQPRRNRSSVIGGPDLVVYIEDHPARSYPEERPYYC